MEKYEVVYRYLSWASSTKKVIGSLRQGSVRCYNSLIYVWGPTVVLGPISQGTN
jgi:hypothetical protein